MADYVSPQEIKQWREQAERILSARYTPAGSSKPNLAHAPKSDRELRILRLIDSLEETEKELVSVTQEYVDGARAGLIKDGLGSWLKH